MAEQLLPCPFCGHAPQAIEDHTHSSGWEVLCMNDNCQASPNVWGAAKDRAIAYWNARVVPPPAPRLTDEQIERLWHKHCYSIGPIALQDLAFARAIEAAAHSGDALDAARYRKLKRAIESHPGGAPSLCRWMAWKDDMLDPGLDAAIDAAMSATGGGNHGS